MKDVKNVQTGKFTSVVHLAVRPAHLTKYGRHSATSNDGPGETPDRVMCRNDVCRTRDATGGLRSSFRPGWHCAADSARQFPVVTQIQAGRSNYWADHAGRAA